MNSFHQKCIFLVIALFPNILCFPQTRIQKEEKQIEYRPGRYIPELHGGLLGKWMGDPRGLYQHIKVPYDGGYGDSGSKYEHDVRDDRNERNEVVRIFQHNKIKPPFALGPQDHLRFMIDFNYKDNGWQIIKFDWVRDGEDERYYNYVNENKLWETQQDAEPQQQEQQEQQPQVIGSDDPGYGYVTPDVEDVSNVSAAPSVDAVPEVSAEPMPYAAEDEAVNDVHVMGEADSNAYNVTYTEQDKQPISNDPNVQASIRQVLDYIANHIIPNLK